MPDITLSPASATLTYAPGTPTIGRSLAPAPGQLVHRGQTPGVSQIQTAASGTQIFIGGVSYGTWFADSFRSDKGLDSSYAASLRMRYTGGSKPAVKQPVALFVDGVKRFGGLVAGVAEAAVQGDPEESWLTLKLTGYGSLLDRTSIAKFYPLPIGGTVAVILFDLWYQKLAAQGISHNYGANPSVVIQPTLFHYRTLREATNILKSQAPGWDIWITDDAELKLAQTDGAGVAAPFELTRAAGIDAISAEDDDSMFRNREIVVGSSAIVSEWKDEYVADGRTAFDTLYVPPVKPRVIVDDVELAVDTLGAWTGAPCWYEPDGYGVSFHVAPAGGLSVVIKYPAPFQLGFVEEDADSIAADGLYEHVTFVPDATDETTCRQIGRGLLNLYGPGGGVIPKKITYAYNSAQQPAWLDPGMLQPVNWTMPDVSGNFTVERVSTEERGGARLWRHTITLRQGPGDVTGISDLAALQAALRPKNVNVPHVATMDVAVNADLASGVQSDFIRLKGDGVLASWDARDPANPGGGAWRIDLRINGASIFPSGDANKINIADGDTTEQSGFHFASENYAYADGDLLTMDIQSPGPLSPERMMVVHLNLLPRLS